MTFQKVDRIPFSSIRNRINGNLIFMQEPTLKRTEIDENLLRLKKFGILEIVEDRNQLKDRYSAELLLFNEEITSAFEKDELLNFKNFQS